MEAVSASFDTGTYEAIRRGQAGFHKSPRGLIVVFGKEAVPFLDGMLTNDMKTLADGDQMLAAFPNAQGRLLAVVRVLRQGDRFIFETEEATREKLYQSLYRFTFAGDFFVEDVSDSYSYFEVHGLKEDVLDKDANKNHPDCFVFELPFGAAYCVPAASGADFDKKLARMGCDEIDHDVAETLRIENGIPKYGVDMDESTIVPELGLDGLISYNKGCYIGQEIIARIHFRGHVAKQLTGLVLSGPPSVADGLTSNDSDVGLYEHLKLQTVDGKDAGRITSVTFSPMLDKTIALAFVRYDYLTEGTEVMVSDTKASVKSLPLVN